MKDNLSQRVVRAMGVAMVSQLAAQAISLVSVAVLMSLLGPSPYGLVATGLPLVALPRSLAVLGVGAAILQAKELTQAEYAAWRRVSILRSIYAVCATVAAIFVARWFGQWDETTTLVAIALAGTTLLAGYSQPVQSLCERELRFAGISLVRLISSTIAALVAIVASLFLASAWPLVIQQYLELVVLALGAERVAQWRPTLKEIATAPPLAETTFGNYFAIANLTFSVGQNLDKTLLAAWLGPSDTTNQAVGFYGQANNLMSRPTLFVSGSVSSVMLPALARVQTRAVSMERQATRFYRLVATLLLPCAMGVLVTAPDLVSALGPKWDGSAPFLSAFAALTLAQGFVNITGSLLGAAGRAKEACWAGAAWSCLWLSAIPLGGWWSGGTSDTQLITAKSVAWIYALLTIGLVVPYLWWAGRLCHLRLSQFGRGILRPLGAALVMGCAVYGFLRLDLLPKEQLVARLAANISLGILVYGGLAWRDALWLWKMRRGTRVRGSA